MRTNNWFLLKLFIYWMLLFFIARIFFVIFLFSNFSQLDLTEWPLSFVYGLRLDIAATAYLIALPTLLWITFLLLKKKSIVKIMNVIQAILTFLILGVLLGNMGIYAAWGTLINARAVAFLQDPEGIIASQTTFVLISQLLFLLITSIALYFLYKKKILNEKGEMASKKSLTLSGLLLLLLPLGMRGGWQEIPINESAASYSDIIPLNHAATNPAWYLLNNLLKSGLNQKNPFLFYDDSTATKNFNAQIDRTSSFTQVLDSGKPNIVLIVLESWTADIITPLTKSSKEEITPFFTSLCDSGLLFTSIYSSGRRTDQMFPSILCGFPAPPNHSVSRFTDKLQHLPFLNRDLAKIGYRSSFFYGGELGFANMNTLLREAAFNSITGKEAFPSDQIYSKWGAHDEHLFSKVLQDLSKAHAPFFSMMLTLSTHEPFDVPGEVKFKGKGEPAKFKNAAYYTDRCLKNFFEVARKTDWYSNTLFILVADHGHILPLKRDYYDPAAYRIPLLWYGNPIKKEFKGKQNNQLGGQHSIAYSLLAQLGVDSKDYVYSNNLLSTNSNRKGVYLNYDSGFGWKEEEEQLVYLFTEQKYLHYSKIESDSAVVLHGKSFLQKLYQGFLRL